MNLSPTETAIRQFLVEDVFYDRDLTSLGPEDSLLQKGLLDSMAILKTVTFCEEQFGITIPDQEVLPDGNLEFLGRRDHQVKTRGYRVELGEIETRLASHPAVDEAVVVAVPDDEVTNRLRAVVVRKAGAEVTSEALRQHCAETLPRYMVPEAVEFREELPRTSSGKVDRRALLDTNAAKGTR